MLLTGLPPELYVRILHRLDSTDDALRGYDFPLRKLYSKYDNELRDYLSKDTPPEGTLHELQKAIGRPRGYRGIAINYRLPLKLGDKFIKFYASTPARFAIALTQLLDDPALNLKFENGRLTLSVADFFAKGNHPGYILGYYATFEFEQTEDKMIIRSSVQLWELWRNTLMIDGKFPFTTKQQAIAGVKQALANNTSRVIHFGSAVGGLLLGSSLFDRKIKLFIRLDWDETRFSFTQTRTFYKHFFALRKMSETNQFKQDNDSSNIDVWTAELNTNSVLAAEPLLYNLAQLPGVKEKREVTYCHYRVR